MITAVDTSVLLDIFGDDPKYRVRSLAALRRCLAEGSIVACEIVWAEVAAAFPDAQAGSRALSRIPVAFSPIAQAAAERAGAAWRAYRGRGGPRSRLIADFLVGAHAMEEADRLLSRNRGFHRLAFAELQIVDPTAG
ncbi:MAG TPA: type II toxin-antitoxin system VapC family toxin [Candidatus Limnocylindrales bacterium]